MSIASYRLDVPLPSNDWLQAFAAGLMARKPELSADGAFRCAMLAHAATWLFEPPEAVELWVAALAVGEREAQRLRGWPDDRDDLR